MKTMAMSDIVIQTMRLASSLVRLTTKMIRKQTISMKLSKRRWMNVDAQEGRKEKLKKLRRNVKNDHLSKSNLLTSREDSRTCRKMTGLLCLK